MRAVSDRRKPSARRAFRALLAAAVFASPTPAAAQDAELAEWQRNRRERFAEFRFAQARRGQAEAEFGPGRTAVIMDDAFAPRMVVVPARPPAPGRGRRVAKGRPIAVGMFPIVYGEYATFVAETGHRSAAPCRAAGGAAEAGAAARSWRDPGFPQSMINPATCIGFDDAQAYAAWLSKRTGRRYRLLSEAEYEFAAGPGDAVARPASAVRPRSTAPVNAGKPNAFGLHDMLGNVLSWTDGRGGREGAKRSRPRRMLMGGSWARGAATPASRRPAPSAYAADDTGFRVAREL